MDVKKLNIKNNTGTLILNDNGKNLKYHLNFITQDDNYTLYQCTRYHFLYLGSLNESHFTDLLNGLEWVKYRLHQKPFPFPFELDKQWAKKMCITVFFEDNKVNKILNHTETVEFFDSLILMEKLSS